MLYPLLKPSARRQIGDIDPCRCNMAALAPPVLLIEPFYGGSHKQLIDLLYAEIPGCEMFTLPAKKWHWRARVSALYFAEKIPRKSYSVLFTSSVLNLTELIGLRPDLMHCKKVLYFHENQLDYPVKKHQDRDLQFGYNQTVSCLAADVVVFNSKFNHDSFLENINTFINKFPDFKPQGLLDQIKPKCKVLHFPVQFPRIHVNSSCHDNETNTTNDVTVTSKTERSDHESGSVVYKTSETQGSVIEVEQRDTRNETIKKIKHDNSATEVDLQKSQYIEPCNNLDECNSHSNFKTDINIKETGSFGHTFEMQSECQQTTRKCGENIGKTFFGAWNNVVTPLLSTSSAKPNVIELIREMKNLDEPLHILWAHRWEHDKDPELFFKTILELHEEGVEFKLSVLGEQFKDVPEIFEKAQTTLGHHIVHWGFQESKLDYYKVLCQADVAVSTAKHEFFGVGMLEAVHCGCVPLAPNALAYPETLPGACLYNTPVQLKKYLRNFCKRPSLTRKPNMYTKKINTERFSWEFLQESYKQLFSTQPH